MGAAETLAEGAHDATIAEHRPEPEAERARKPDPEWRVLDASPQVPVAISDLGK
jgi:hypothetical protein